MNVLIVGSGGREHALAWKISNSPLCNHLCIAPGNAGTAIHGTNVPIQADAIDELRQFSIDNQIDLVIVGPEGPLVAGIQDAFCQPGSDHIGLIGPSAYAAQLEGSKAFAKEFMHRNHIPTARSLEVDKNTMDAGKAFLTTMSPPYVLKADGLAAGKGVLIIQDYNEACRELEAMIQGKFGEASARVVIEEFLDGIEFSVFALTDGKDYVLLPEAKDYKRIGVGDTGLNTGGMGAVSPVPFVDNDLWKKVEDQIVRPTIQGIANEGMVYFGFVFFGLMNVNGSPYVIEYNCRLGDPETEAIIPRIENDLLEVFDQTLKGNLSDVELNFKSEFAATVMLVSGGYPGDFDKGKEIKGIENIQDSLVFHAGSKNIDNTVVTNGGRVLAITSLHPQLGDALAMSKHNAEKIQYEGKYFRRDIGFDL
jgi:phosphoribosylamine--glycine ligase